MLITVAFGFSSGLPLALVFGTLSLWLKDYSIAYRTIGAFFAVASALFVQMAVGTVG